MKLRNKKTGEVFDALIREKGGAGSYSLIVCDIKAYERSKSTLDETHFVLDEYWSLAELNQDWEDVGDINVTNIPLIKDEKIRKAVRAWAETNQITNVRYDACWNAFRCSDFVLSFDYDFDRRDGLEDGKTYTIEELCGEEEE